MQGVSRITLNFLIIHEFLHLRACEVGADNRLNLLVVGDQI